MNYDEPDYDDSPSVDSEGKLTISATTIQYDARALFDSIVRIASHSVIKDSSTEIKKSVHTEVRDTIQDRVSALIDAAVQEGIQPVNNYGEPTGERTTLKAMIGKAGDKYLEQPVDKNGSPTSYQSVGTRMQFLVTEAVKKHIDYRLETEIKKAVEQAVIEARAKVGTIVGEIITKLQK